MSSSWVLINVPRDALCQISLCWLNPIATSPRNGHYVALLWPKHGPDMVLQIGSSWILINVPRDVPCQISHCLVYLVAPFPRNVKIWPFMAKTWFSYCPSNLFFLSFNQCAQGCSMPNFTLLDVSCSPLSQKWPKYDLHGQNMVLILPFKFVPPES